MSQREGESSGTLLQHSVVVALAVIVLVHSLLIALWLAPSGPLRTGTGPGFISRYVDPYFKQSWTSLDPSSQRVDERLRIRARVRDDSGSDELIETPWVDVTATDVAAVHLDISPPRVRLIARRLATNVNATYLDLDREGRAAAQKNFIHTLDSGSRLRAALRIAGVSAAEAGRYVNNDRMVVRFASLYAVARWGSGVQQVQYSAGRRVAPERGEGSIDDVPFVDSAFGWRRLVRPLASAQETFDDYVTAAPNGEVD